MEENNLPGTVVYFGCPAEESGCGKTFMAREGVFDDVDIALTWHPGSTNSVWGMSSLANIVVFFHFKGVTAHAAAVPHLGRSALDAAELMNVGVNFLREHVIPEARMHYAFTEVGGGAPNVVQDRATVLYYIRAPKTEQVMDIFPRVVKCAEGAALMTGTTFERIFVDGTANAVPNTTLEKLLYSNMGLVPMPDYTDEELAFVSELDATCPPSDVVPGTGAQFDVGIREKVWEMSDHGKKSLNNFLMPFYSGNEFEPGSSDVGDVSWQTPAAQFNTVCFTAHSPGHSWQNVSSGASSIGDKGMLYAAKVLACSAADLFEDVSIIEKARAEFTARLGGEEYMCPIPPDAVPYIIEG
jgi:aminobenzoyl-glutamate utilization protein B